MKKIYLITILTSIFVITVIVGIYNIFLKKDFTNRQIKVGFIYVGDDSTSYTGNFIKAQKAVENAFGDKVKIYAKYNIQESNCTDAFQDLIDKKCNIIFSTSYGYGKNAKEFAGRYPNIQICQATCSNAIEQPIYKNYHTFMGHIYEGRYVCGVVAGLKLKELIDDGKITSEQAKIGYVGAFPYAEVISGFTAFFLGVRSVVPQATMTVKYTNSWTDYVLEKKCTEELINAGCIIISQHSDTTGPAVACEKTENNHFVYLVSYNQNMADVAPTTYLTGSKINWTPYILSAVNAVFYEKRIEENVNANINGNDAGAGFDKDWVQILEFNKIEAAKGTQEKIEETIKALQQKKIQVFKGNYTGINPFDASDTIDLSKGFIENAKSSAPSFHYILKDVITEEK